MKRIHVLLLTLLATTSLLAGCGDDTSSKPSGTDDATAPKSAPAEDAPDADVSGETQETQETQEQGEVSGGGTADPRVATRTGCPKGGPASGRGKGPDAAPTPDVDPAKTYTATMKTNKGTIVAKLLAKDAPNAVTNFVVLACSGYYTDIAFHRVIKDFMIQTGDPDGTGMGGPTYTIEDDPTTREYTKGTLAMANTGAPNSAGSQFFIVHAGDAGLPKTYTIFGEVTKGLDVVDAIAATPVTDNGQGEPSRPTSELMLESVAIAVS